MTRQIGPDRKSTNIILVSLISFFMIWELQKMINFPGSEEISWWLQAAELAVFGAVLVKIDLHEHRWMIVLLLGLVVVFLTSALRSMEVLQRTRAPLMRGVLVYGLCPSMGILLADRDVKKFLQAFIAIWVVFHTALCVVGIWCMYTGTQIIDFSMQYEINNRDGVLKLMAYHTVAAANVMLAILMAVIGTTIMKNKVFKILYGLCICAMLYALALTTGRAGMVAAAIGLGIAAGAPMISWLNKKAIRKWLRWVILICIIAVVAIVTLQLFGLVQADYDRRMENGSIPLFGTAAAESMTVSSHDVLQLAKRSGLSGREKAYRIAFRLLKEQPQIMVTGTSVPLIMEYINATEPLGYDHVHCLPMQILIETGIWGLALFIIMLVFFVRAAWKLYFSYNRPMWQRLIFIPTAGMLCIEAIECITRLGSEQQAAVPTMLFLGLTITIAKRKEEMIL